jgi:hypothetical protein
VDVNELRTLLLGETWTLPLGVGLLALCAVAADRADLHWWPYAAGPILLVATTVLVLGAIRRTSRG